MAAALDELKTLSNKYVIVKVIFVTASQVSFISEYWAQLLNCSGDHGSYLIKGVGSIVTPNNSSTHLTCG